MVSPNQIDEDGSPSRGFFFAKCITRPPSPPGFWRVHGLTRSTHAEIRNTQTWKSVNLAWTKRCIWPKKHGYGARCRGPSRCRARWGAPQPRPVACRAQCAASHGQRRDQPQQPTPCRHSRHNQRQEKHYSKQFWLLQSAAVSKQHDHFLILLWVPEHCFTCT